MNSSISCATHVPQPWELPLSWWRWWLGDEEDESRNESHRRVQLHYQLLPVDEMAANNLTEDELEGLQGSCNAFYIEETDQLLEVDACTHKEIFMQDEEGVLRLGENGADWFDWTQKDVVAVVPY